MSNPDNPRCAEVLAYLKEYFEIEGESAMELLDSFIESVEENLVNAEQNLAAANWQDLSRNGHSIKGTAANVGANELSEAGKAIEFAAKAQQGEECRAQIARVVAIMAEMK